jgi:5-methylcytosine-specific restriction endonuclease McrA
MVPTKVNFTQEIDLAHLNYNINSNDYSQLLLSPQWRIKRELILIRDNYCCRNCGAQNNLNVHHRQYHSHTGSGEKFKPREYRNRYLVTLCQICHKAGHDSYKIPVFYL